MKKYYLVPQPPLSDFYSFLVDELHEFEKWGVTTDLSKIEYNLGLLSQFHDREPLDILAAKGGVKVYRAGMYIVVIEIIKNKKKNTASMTFWHCMIPLKKDDLHSKILSTFPKKVAKEWLDLHASILLVYSKKDDNVVLLKDDDDEL